MLSIELSSLYRCRTGLALGVLCLQSALAFAAPAPPPNDLCAGAEVIPASGPFPYRSLVIPDITSATTAGDPVLSPSDPNCYQIVSRGIWYKFTPATAALYVLSVNDTATTVKDTFMGVYVSGGGCGGPFALLNCNDDAGLTQSAVAMNLA